MSIDLEKIEALARDRIATRDAIAHIGRGRYTAGSKEHTDLGDWAKADNAYTNAVTTEVVLALLARLRAAEAYISTLECCRGTTAWDGGVHQRDREAWLKLKGGAE